VAYTLETVSLSLLLLLLLLQGRVRRAAIGTARLMSPSSRSLRAARTSRRNNGITVCAVKRAPVTDTVWIEGPTRRAAQIHHGRRNPALRIRSSSLQRRVRLFHSEHAAL